MNTIQLPKLAGGILAAMLIMSCNPASTFSPPVGVASIKQESIVALPRFNRYDALLDAIPKMIASGDFSTSEEFLDSFTGLFRQDGVLYFQLGGSPQALREYTTEAKVREIPGPSVLAADSPAWWPNRADPKNAPYLQMIAGSMSQELYTERMNGL
ncbi:hypothetical protein WJU23_07240 [Prosthecobacter sp. SYSU 5D2]|uniref:hypothetical protein n=1 Tax=Prosthecobacter sp. SYSU 5D2 TaxID=3134134 RepID=UPI0031FE65FB